MKKFASIIVSTLLLVTLLSAMAIPAAAANLSGELCESKTYDDTVTINGDATVISGKNLIFNKALCVNLGKTLTVESGASVTAKSIMNIFGNLIVKSGGTVEFYNSLNIQAASKLEIGGTLKGEWITSGIPTNTNNITLLPGGKIEVKFTDDTIAKAFAQGLENYKPTVTNINDNSFIYLVTAEVAPCLHDQGFTEDGKCKLCNRQCPHDQGFTADEKCKNCNWQCTHEEWNNSVCTLCGHVCTHEGEACGTCGKEFSITAAETTPTNNETTPETEPPTASTLSEGSLAVICSVAGIAVGFLVAMFIFKKKKPATAGGENTDEE